MPGFLLYVIFCLLKYENCGKHLSNPSPYSEEDYITEHIILSLLREQKLLQY